MMNLTTEQKSKLAEFVGGVIDESKHKIHASNPVLVKFPNGEAASLRTWLNPSHRDYLIHADMVLRVLNDLVCKEGSSSKTVGIDLNFFADEVVCDTMEVSISASGKWWPSAVLAAALEATK